MTTNCVLILYFSNQCFLPTISYFEISHFFWGEVRLIDWPATPSLLQGRPGSGLGKRQVGGKAFLCCFCRDFWPRYDARKRGEEII